MAEMGIAVLAAHFRSGHQQFGVLFLDNILRHQRTGETGPPGAGFEFIRGTEQRLARHDINVNAFFLIVPIFILERRLGAVFLRDFILHRRQFFAQNLIGRFGILAVRAALIAPVLLDETVPARAFAIAFVVLRIFLIIILMILLSRIKRARFFYRRYNRIVESARLFQLFFRRFSELFLFRIVIKIAEVY